MAQTAAAAAALQDDDDSPLKPASSPLSAPAAPPAAPANDASKAPVESSNVETVRVTAKAPSQYEQDRARLDDSIRQLDVINKETGALKPPQMAQAPPPPKPQQTNPVQAWGSAAMVFAAIGSLMTRQPLTTAMNAGAAVMQAYKKNDQEATNQAYEEWKVASENVVKQQNFQLELYKSALSEINTDEKGALAKVSAYAKAVGDDVTYQRVQQEGRDGLARALAEQQNATTNFYKNMGSVVEGKSLMDAMNSPDFKAQLATAKTPQEAADMKLKLMQDVAPGLAKQNGILTDDDYREMADQAIAGDKSVLTGLGYGQAGSLARQKVRHFIDLELQAQGKTGKDLAAANAEYAGIMSGERTLGTVAARIGLGAAELKQLEPQVLQASSALKRTNYPNMNAMIQAGQRATGDPQLRDLAVRLQGLKSAFSQVLTRGGATTDAARAATDELFSSTDPDSVIQYALYAVNSETSAIEKAPGMVREQLRGGLGGNPVAPPAPPPGYKMQKAASQDEFNKLPHQTWYNEPNDPTVYYKP